MNVSTVNLQSLIRASAKKLAEQQAGKSGHGTEWEHGFLQGMEYVAKYVIPAVENEEKQECDAIADSITFEHEMRESRRRFFEHDDE